MQLNIESANAKMLRETLCLAQSRFYKLEEYFDSEWSPERAIEMKHHAERIQELINEIDKHRPLGSDGKHGNRHTSTCGCEDT